MKKHLLFALLLLVAATVQAQDPGNKPDTKTLKIKYLFEVDLSQAHEDYIGEFEVGQKYLVGSPAIEGYRPEPDTVKGKMPDHDVVDTVLYYALTQTHTITVNPLIAHGSISVDPSGQVEVGTTVTITATPHDGYVLSTLIVFSKDDVSQTVEIDNQTFVMPDFDVMVSGTFDVAGEPPVINGDIETPAAICAGDVLDLTEPSFSDATEHAWQLSAHTSFSDIVVYEGQPLDASYNGWSLRFMAANPFGEVYSNVVTITVKDMGDLTLSGDLSSCTGLVCKYSVAHAGDAVLTWQVTDDKAVVESSGNKLTVLWGSKGTQKVLVQAEDPDSGCSVELSLDVTVQSYIEERDVQDIVAKKHDGKDYLLIYPNPKDTYKYQWYKDGKAIAGANGQYYYPAEGLADGDYQVYISYNADADGNLFCGAFTTVYTVRANRATYALYPNPASTGESLVVVNEGNDAELFVYTLDGKLVHHQMVANGKQSVGVVLPQGIYVVCFNDGENVTIERIIIQ